MRRTPGQTLFVLIALLIPFIQGCKSVEVQKIEIPNALWIGEGVLSGGQPDEEQLRLAAEAGYRTIVNLRGPGEEGSLENEETLVRSLGMNYVTIPIADAGAMNETNARKLAEIVSGHDMHPAMVHCRSGNRVGVLIALKAYHLDGAAGAEAFAIGQEAGMRKPPTGVYELFGVEPPAAD